ncbi:MAG: right-handed parallel beta-helix repeat-containing protein, partial [Planctomycetaceae bacterium]|nr:right-handed parallel beta-helix repeat-containing protein [Planctomycetaceae bacterium]
MSLRGFFSRNTDSHRRRKNASTSPALSSRAEYLEDRVLLSVDSPTLINHGISFNNLNVLDSNIFFYAVNNPRFSNNVGGSGLNVQLDGAQTLGNPPATPAIPQLNSVNLSPALGPLVFNNNANTGASLTLQNMTLDSLIVDAAQFNSNGRAGLIINLTNVTVDNIIIANSNFLNNANDGLCLIGSNVNTKNIQILNNNFSANSRTTTTSGNAGALLRFSDSRIGQFSINGNTFTDNGGHGLHLDLDNTSVSNLEMNLNSANVNARNGNFAGAFLDFQDSDVGGTITNNNFGGNRFQPNPFNPNLTQGEGLLVQTRRSILPDGSVSPGLRNLQLDTVRGNSFTTNGGAGLMFDIGQNTTLRSNISANNMLQNGRTGLTIQAKDTQDAFDVQIGGTTLDSQNNSADANTITGNRGAGVVVSLDDTSSVLGNTTGRFRMFNNVISNNVNDNLLSTEFAGEGLFVRARGSVALTNGAARLLNSRIDGNTIEGNAGSGMLFDISEDSEVIDLLIGDEADPVNPNEGFEGDGFIFENQFIRNSGNVVRNNLGDGLNFLRRDAALAQNVRVLDNLFEGNANGVSYTVRNLDNVVNTLDFAYNDLVNNTSNGLQLATQIDAILIADLDRNLISGNGLDGILTLGFEGDSTDFETLGGTWTRNTIQDNQLHGVAINGVPGVVSTLQIGLLGTDSMGASLGNLINGNGDDGVEINAPGVVRFENNLVTFNGQNNINPVTGLPDVHGDGKGFDINLNDVGLPFNTSGDLNVYLGFNVVEGNFGDGLEIVTRDSNLTTFAEVELLAYGNIIDLNAGRGVDILNAGDDADTYVVFGDG